MSHYNSYAKQPIRKYSNEQQSFLNRKRQDHESDHVSKKRYEYEEKYDHYDKYDRYQPSHQNKYHGLLRDYPPNYYHAASKQPNYHPKDYFYSNKNYHNGYSNKSPRRDHKKPFQKYTNNETEGIRNLSHCDLPSSPIKKQENSPSPKNKKDAKDEMLQNGIDNIDGLNDLGGIGTIVNNIDNSYPPRNITYQNQQNINIKINVTSPGINNGSNTSSSTTSRKRNQMNFSACNIPNTIQNIQNNIQTVPSTSNNMMRERTNDMMMDSGSSSNLNIKSKKLNSSSISNSHGGGSTGNIEMSKNSKGDKNQSQNLNVNINLDTKDKDSQVNEDYDLLFKCPISKPPKIKEVSPFNRNSVKIEKNVFDIDSFNMFPNMEIVPFQQKNCDDVSNAHVTGNIGNSPCGKSDKSLGAKISIESNYLLSKIKNWSIVNIFVPPKNLLMEKFCDIPLVEEDTNKFYVVYDEKFEKEVDKVKDESKEIINKNKGDILLVKQNLEHSSYDIRKHMFKLLSNKYQIDQCDIQVNAINEAVEKNTSEY